MDRVVTVGDIARHIANRFPVERSEGWDRAGLLAGDPAAPVAGVAFALDPTLVSISQAVRHGANVLVTHHPAFLEGPNSLVPGAGPGGVVFSALNHGVALINAHTNLDRDVAAQSLMPETLGLTIERPLEVSTQPMRMVVVYAPVSHAQAVRDSMAAAGAGRIGDYEACSFSQPGVGRYRTPEGGTPFAGTPGEATSAEEERIEMVCPPNRVDRVVAAMRDVHPYEEPLITAHDIAIARNSAALGMLSSAPQGTTLSRLVDVAAERYGCVPTVWGDPEKPIGLVATGTGSASSLVGTTISSGADVLVAGEVRYHDALNAMDAGLAIVELGHDVTEWPLVSLLESVVRGIDGIEPDDLYMLGPTRGWWTPQDRER